MSVENVCSKCDAEYDTRHGKCPACGYKEPRRAQEAGGSSSAATLLEWLRAKLKDAEKSLKCREEMSATWRGGTDKSWRTAGCKLNKAQRLAEADTHARIMVKCRREVEMFKAVIERLSHSNNRINNSDNTKP